MYRHILIAADFSEHGARVTEKARDLAERYQAKLSIIHVVENLPIVDSSFVPAVPYDVELTEQMIEAAQSRLADDSARLGIPENQRWVEVGSPKSEIVRVATEQNVDLIVLGSHGRHGFGLLLGSTASSVIHHAECDVLAVRLKA